MTELEQEKRLETMKSLVKMNLEHLQEEMAERDEALKIRNYTKLDFLRNNHTINGIVRIESELLGLTMLIVDDMEKRSIHEGCG